jgi:hypothetical protein
MEVVKRGHAEDVAVAVAAGCGFCASGGVRHKCVWQCCAGRPEATYAWTPCRPLKSREEGEGEEVEGEEEEEEVEEEEEEEEEAAERRKRTRCDKMAVQNAPLSLSLAIALSL